MRGYSLLSISLFAISIASPRPLQNIQRLYLATGKIVADRKSPAFSAIEDAFILNELIDNKKPKKEKKINLTGLKVSLRTAPIKLHKVSLRGELIGVAHFTEKFIARKNIQVAAAQPAVSIYKENSDFKIEVSKVRGLSSAPQEKGSISLPGGITLTMPRVKRVNIVTAPISSALTKVSTRVPAFQANVIAGLIELNGRGSFSGDNFSYYINRRVDGKTYEAGVVDAEAGSFKMEVGSLEGILEVELRSERGEVLAYGERILNKKTDNVKMLKIQIYPSETLLAGRVLSSSKSFDGIESPIIEAEKLIEGVDGRLKVSDDGYFNEDIFDKGSSFIVKTASKDYWSDLNFGVAGRPLYPRLIKKDVFKNFAKTLDPFGEEVEVRSAIVGSVTQQGLAQQGVEVRLFSNEYQKPVYFGPKGSAKPRLKKTTTNGGFIFINIPDGGYLVQAIGRGKILAQKWYVVKEGHISQGQISIRKNPSLVASVESFPSSRADEEFVLHELGIDDENFGLSSNGETIVNTITNSELLALRIERSKNYADHIYLTSTKLRKKRFKVVKKEWLESFLNHRRSNVNRALGVVVGFISQNDFKVVKEATTAQSATSQVFYFDKYGEHTEYGRVGGGFIITDVPSGLRSVVISMRGSENFLNKVVTSKPYSVSIF